MSDQAHQEKNDTFLRTVIISVICLPIIAWLLYNAYQKSQESPIKTTACSDTCTTQGYPGYDFKCPCFQAPQCTCIGTRQ